MYSFMCENHMDFPYLIEMRYEFTYTFEHIENGTLVICPTLLISYYFHITKLTRHVFLSKLPLKVSKLIQFSLCLLYIHIHVVRHFLSVAVFMRLDVYFPFITSNFVET